MNKINLETLADAKLLELYSEIMVELQRRGVTHSTNNPVANLAESLVTKALSLEKMPESTKGYDAIDSDGRRYEIKGRRPTENNQSRQLSSLRELDKQHFDFLAGVLFHENLSVSRACVIPHAIVLQRSKYNKHANGWVFHLRDDIWNMPGVRDITGELKTIEGGQQAVACDAVPRD